MSDWISENYIFLMIAGGTAVFIILLIILIRVWIRNAARRRSGYPDFEGMDGQDFEVWCARLLADNGFESIRLTKGSGDQGVDILARKDDVKFAFQCKLYSTPLGNKPVQEIYTGKTIYSCHVGVVMTNSTFTSGAKEAAEKTGVILWDIYKLEEMVHRE